MHHAGLRSVLVLSAAGRFGCEPGASDGAVSSVDMRTDADWKK